MPVIVEALDLRWFYTDRKNFVAFSTILATMPVSFYSSKFAILVVKHFWDETQKTIVKKQFIPYMIFVVVSTVHFHSSLLAEALEERDSDSWPIGRVTDKITGFISSLLLSYSLWIEYMQIMSKENKYEYFYDFFNWMDVSGLLCTLFVMVMTVFEL